jgi:hypothetical protein
MLVPLHDKVRYVLLLESSGNISAYVVATMTVPDNGSDLSHQAVPRVTLLASTKFSITICKS